MSPAGVTVPSGIGRVRLKGPPVEDIVWGFGRKEGEQKARVIIAYN